MYGTGDSAERFESVDVCTRYSSMQYLIILFETEESKIKDIMERIFTQYRKEYKGTPLLPKYEYISMMKEREKRNSGVVYNRKISREGCHTVAALLKIKEYF